MIAMEAIRSFSGEEGFFRRGERFYVSSTDRAQLLSTNRLARVVEELQDPNTPPTAAQPATEPARETTTIAPFSPAGEAWGIVPVGDEFFLPDGQRLSGFSEAKERLLQLLSAEFVKPEEARVKLTAPVNGPQIIWTEATEAAAPLDTQSRRFEDEVQYLGGGWYLLPGGERVLGKVTARDVWKIQRRERG